MEWDISPRVSVEHDEVVFLLGALKEYSTVVDVDVKPRFASVHSEILFRDLHNLRVYLRNVDGHVWIISQEGFGASETASADEEDASYVRVEQEPDVEVVGVGEDGSVGVLKVHGTVQVIIHYQIARCGLS